MKKYSRKSNICAEGGTKPPTRISLGAMGPSTGLRGSPLDSRWGQDVFRIELWDSSDPGLPRSTTRFSMCLLDTPNAAGGNIRERATSARNGAQNPQRGSRWGQWAPQRGSTVAHSIPDGAKASTEWSEGIPVILDCPARPPALVYSRRIYYYHFEEIFEKEQHLRRMGH